MEETFLAHSFFPCPWDATQIILSPLPLVPWLSLGLGCYDNWLRLYPIHWHHTLSKFDHHSNTVPFLNIAPLFIPTPRTTRMSRGRMGATWEGTTSICLFFGKKMTEATGTNSPKGTIFQSWKFIQCLMQISADLFWKGLIVHISQDVSPSFHTTWIPRLGCSSAQEHYISLVNTSTELGHFRKLGECSRVTSASGKMPFLATASAD